MAGGGTSVLPRPTWPNPDTTASSHWLQILGIDPASGQVQKVLQNPAGACAPPLSTAQQDAAQWTMGYVCGWASWGS